MSKNKIYFISDLHLGLHPEKKSLEREKLIVKWLDEIKENAKELYLLGDIFDFWHEYKHVVPRGNIRFWGNFRRWQMEEPKFIFSPATMISGRMGILSRNWVPKFITNPSSAN